MIKITNGKLLTPEGISEKNLYIENGKIVEISDCDKPCDVKINAEGNYVSPGFIDMHCHGGAGHDFMDGTKEDILEAAHAHLKHGTTTIYPTSLACDIDVLKNALNMIREAQKECKSNIPGVHLEGPYFSKDQCGAQNLEYITPPDEAEYKELVSLYGDLIKKWSFAPELEGSEKFCEFLIENGIVPSIAHSNAKYEDVKAVYDKGLRSMTHFYSCMSTITREKGFRKLGIIESAYLLDDINIEIIADGCHLPPELLKLICKSFKVENIALVTDAMRGATQPDGPSVLGRLDDGLDCVVEDGVAKLLDRSAFAGSVATADRLVRTMYKLAGVSICDAVKMMTSSPAKMMGLKTKGRLEKGMDADIVIFDDNINIKEVIVNGETV
ncbi:MAG: N-acetylglucosamine-6-phosphate deacetylase [Clostridia bacterium]|nr:N-acetylglucosamine-6-phosphate deacetylase [Clostridia bacterium]